VGGFRLSSRLLNSSSWSCPTTKSRAWRPWKRKISVQDSAACSGPPLIYPAAPSRQGTFSPDDTNTEIGYHFLPQRTATTAFDSQRQSAPGTRPASLVESIGSNPTRSRLTLPRQSYEGPVRPSTRPTSPEGPIVQSSTRPSSIQEPPNKPGTRPSSPKESTITHGTRPNSFEAPVPQIGARATFSQGEVPTVEEVPESR